MNLTRAKEICAAISEGYFAPMGLGSGIPDWLKTVSLSEMVEAARIVKEQGREKRPDGSTVITAYPDDRLIAAVFTLVNYEAGPIPGNTKMIVHDGADRGVFVANVSMCKLETGEAA